MSSASKNKIHLQSKSRPKYHIELDNFIRIPANVYWKDLSGIHLGCNEYTANDTGLSSVKDYVGLTIYDISKTDNAKLIDKIDKHIVKSKKPNCMIESSGSLHSQQGVYLSIKSPLFDCDGKVAGLFGISFKIEDENFSKITHSLGQLEIVNGFNIINDVFLRYYLSKIALQTAGLTQRESEILFHLCQGKTAKKIAKFFDISNRTIETHIEHIKLKTKCQTKYQLIEKFSLLNNI